jgi:hypothetical protein
VAFRLATPSRARSAAVRIDFRNGMVQAQPLRQIQPEQLLTV